MALTQTSLTPKVFTDSSVLFAATYSETGRAYDLIVAGLRGEVALCLSPLVLTETERNVTNKTPRILPSFRAFAEVLSPYLVTPTPTAVRHTATVIHPKDAPIVAAAHAARAQFLATYDRKHLLNHAEQIREAFGLLVMTPDDILKAFGK